MYRPKKNLSLFLVTWPTLNIFFLLEESRTDPLFDFWHFLPACVSRPNQNAVNAFIVPCDLIYLLKNYFILQLLYLRHIFY
jgi:hypothetical protein